MKHEPPPRMPDEPPFMAEFRAIDAHITEQVNRYVALCRRMQFTFVVASLAGYWIGFVTVEALKWWAGLP